MANIALAQCMVDRSTLVTGLDDAIFTMHFFYTGAWDDATRDATAVDIKNFWISASVTADSAHYLREVRWYDVPASAPYRPVYKRTSPQGTPPGYSGSGTGSVLPPQNAATVTLKTDSRKHWGRFYLPLTASSALDTTAKGAIKASVCDIVATAAAVLANQVAGAGHGQLIVWSPTLGTMKDITQVQVDNVADIQRRRRVKRATYKKTILT